MGGKASGTKGSRRERELVDVLGEVGFTAMRAPASGSATVRELPDVIAACPVTTEDSFVGERFALVYAIEAKASAGKPVYLDADEVAALEEFADGFGARPRIAVKFDVKHGDPAYGEDASGFYLFHPDDLYRTGEGNYRVKKETALREGTPVEAL